jgi:branched-chain amino acid transport system ATP-binding protein
MVSLARALAAKPRLLLIDELSLGLAPLPVARLLEAIRAAAARGVGVLMVEQHARKALASADRAYVLRRGAVALAGDSQELLANFDAVERSYFTSADQTHP